VYGFSVCRSELHPLVFGWLPQGHTHKPQTTKKPHKAFFWVSDDCLAPPESMIALMPAVGLLNISEPTPAH